MFEKYDPEYTKETMIGRIRETYPEAKTRAAAIALARQKIPKESFYQNRIRKALKERYPDAFCRKISQGVYAEGGIPDILFILDGHYYGFEVKRPLLGEVSSLQRQTIARITAAGGTAAVISWPEEAIAVIEGRRK